MKKTICISLLALALSVPLAAAECCEEEPSYSVDSALSFFYTQLSHATGMKRGSKFLEKVERLVNRKLGQLLHIFDSPIDVYCVVDDKPQLLSLNEKFIGFILQKTVESMLLEPLLDHFPPTADLQQEIAHGFSDNKYKKMREFLGALQSTIEAAIAEPFATQYQAMYMTMRAHKKAQKSQQEGSPPTPSQIDPTALRDLEEVPLCL